MNHRPRTAVPTMLLACAAALLGASAPVLAQQATIPGAARSATEQAQYKQAIDQFVKQQVARLNDTTTPGNIRQARVQLEAQVGGNATPSFLQAYAASLNANIQPLANAKDLITRLNAAIVVAHVAEKAKNTELAPAAAKFMNDPQDSVALWGVKAAKQIIPVILNANGAQDPLTPNLLNAVKKNWFSGAIAYEAYDALRLNTNAPGAGPAGPGAPPAGPAAIKAAVPPMLALMAFRADLYAKGVPPNPMAETIAFEFLTRSKVWPNLTAVQQGQVLQQIANIVSAAGQHANVVGPEAIAPLATMLQTAGSGIQVIGQATADTATTEAGKPLRNLGVSSPGPTIFAATGTTVTGLLGSPKWKTVLKAPATLNDAGKILSPNEPLEDEAAPAATTAGGSTGGAGGPGAAGAGTTPKSAGTGNTAGGGGAGKTGAAGGAGTGNGAAGAGAGAGNGSAQ
jgi:hypothetical protein